MERPAPSPALLHGDAAEQLKGLPDASVDLVIVDPPYGITSAKWDKTSDEWWDRVWRLLEQKCKASILVFGVDPFLTERRMQESPSIAYKYDLIWVKNVPSGMSNVAKQPMRQHENIAYFLKRGVGAQDVYRPQKRRRITPIAGYATKASSTAGISGQLDKTMRVQREKNPTSVIHFPKVKAAKSRPWLALHPTQKPTALLKYLIETYSKPGDTVLDFCMGSGSTGVAALACGRAFVGIESNAEFYERAKRRLEEYHVELPHMETLYTKHFVVPV